MTVENLKKKHAQLKWLASGDFTERDFDYKIKATDNPGGKKGEGGWSSMGDMKPERKQLIQQDAARTLEAFEKKHPEFANTPKADSTTPAEKLVQSKSKGKK